MISKGIVKKLRREIANWINSLQDRIHPW